MMKNICIIVVVLLLLLPAVLVAQDILPFRETLHWFPDGAYSLLSHMQLRSMQESDFADAFADIGGIDLSTSPVRAIVGPDFTDSVRYYSSGVIYTSFELQGENTTDEAGRTIIGTYYPSEHIMVIVVDDAPAIARAALEAGRWQRVDAKVGKLPVYRAGTYEAATIKGTRTIAVAGQQMLCVALSESMLRRMLDAGLGRELSLLDSAEYADIFDIVPDGQVWHVQAVGASQRLTIEAQLASGKLSKEVADRKLAQLKQRWPQYVVNATRLDSEGMYMDHFQIYASEDAAEAAYAIPSRTVGDPSAPQQWVTLMEMLEKRTKITLDGDTIYRTTHMDRETLEYRNANEAVFKEWREEKEKEREQRLHQK